jgi:excinuclease ABC subunit C
MMVVILYVRKGYLTGSRNYPFQVRNGISSEVIEAFTKQYYPRESFIPAQILISEPIPDLPSIMEWLTDLAGKRVRIHCPRRGEKRRLIEMALSNAENLLDRKAEIEQEDLMGLMQSVLKLKNAPQYIEGIDISNFHGDMAVGAVVSFDRGAPRRSGYRNYKIKGIEGIDDYGMMAEIVTRRLAKEAPPDMFVVDGGKGHLMAVKKVLDEMKDIEIPELVAIAKGDETGQGDRIFIPGRKNPIPLKGDHPVLLLLMRIRDEAHRRAVTYHRKLRGKKIHASALDGIPGIGDRRKAQLLHKFGDINTLSCASEEELAAVPGISRKLAQGVVNFFRESGDNVG